MTRIAANSAEVGTRNTDGAFTASLCDPKPKFGTFDLDLAANQTASDVRFREVAVKH